MKNVVHSIFAFFFFYLTISAAVAQTDYVVTIKGDTIRGKTKFASYGMEQSVQLTTADKKKTTYTILKTRAFSNRGEIYHPVRTDKGFKYMKLIKGGYLSLYAFQMTNQTAWDGRYLQKRDGSSMEVPNLGFKKYMTKFLSDCPEIESRFEAKEFSKTDVIEIVDVYNDCLQNITMAKQGNAPETTQKLAPWNELEQAVQSAADFDGKTTALEMISEIKTKVERKEKIPGFLSDGLKNSLRDQASLKELLDKALAETK